MQIKKIKTKRKKKGKEEQRGKNDAKNVRKIFNENKNNIYY